MSLVPFDTKNTAVEAQESAVSAYLEQARGWLHGAVERTPHAPDAATSIAAAKAELSTAAEATRQLNLSKDIQADAMEMVRRADYALGCAIRKGQAEGTINSQGKGGGNPRFTTSAASVEVASPYDFAKHTDLYGDGREGGNGVYAMADNATAEEFEEALAEAKAEGNLSRSNVVRKIRGGVMPQTRNQSNVVRVQQITELATQGRTSEQIGDKLGLRAQRVRQLARNAGIEIPGDKVSGKTRRLDSVRILSGVAESLDAAVFALRQVDPAQLTGDQIQEWVGTLSNSVNALRSATHKIKEFDR